MGRRDWAKLDSSNDLEALGVAPRRGRGWAIACLLLGIGGGGFVVGYYIPLYRAHTRLLTEFQGLSKEAKVQHQQLTTTLATLKDISDQKDQLTELVRKEQESKTAANSRAEAILQSLQSTLRRFVSKGWLKLEQKQNRVQATLLGPALVSADGKSVTAQGRKALCLAATALKSTPARLSLGSRGVRAQDDTVWTVAAVRAADAARVLTEDCGFDVARLEVRLGHPTTDTAGSVVVLEIESP